MVSEILTKDVLDDKIVRLIINVILVTQSEAWRHPESLIATGDAGQASMTGSATLVYGSERES